MSYFPNFLELQRSNNYMDKNDCQLPRSTMNELVMNYLVTGKIYQFDRSDKKWRFLYDKTVRR